MAEAVLDIVPRVEEYQRRIAQLPGWTDKAAAAAAKKLEARLKNAQAEAVYAAQTAAERAAKEAAAAAEKVLAGLVAFDAIGSIKSFFEDIAEGRHELQLLSQSTGIALDTLDALRLGATLAGVDFSAVGDVFEDFAGSVVDFARDGSGKGQKVFSELGVSVRDVKGELRSTNDVLIETLGRLQDLDNPTQRAGYLVQLFSDKAGQLQAVLADVDIDTLIRGAERFGLFAGQAAKNTASWTHATGGLQVVAEYAATTITTKLFGTDMSGALQRFTLGFVAAFTFVSEYVTGWAKDQVSAVGAVWDFISRKGTAADALKAIGDAFSPVDDLTAARDAAAEAARAWYELQKATAATTGAVAGHTQATLVDTAAQAKAAAEAEKRAKAEQTAYEKLQATIATYRAKGLDAWRQITDRRDRALEQLDELTVSERTGAAAAQAAALIRQDALREEIALRDELARKFLDQVAKQKQEDEDALKRTVEGAQAGIAAAFERLDADAAAELERQKAIEASREVQKNAFAQSLEYARQTVGGIIDLFDTQTREGRRAALALFAVQKAVSVAQIAVNTAQAITAALTIPPPAGPILALATGAAAAVQAGAALAAQPRFHTGLFNDEQPAVIRRGEVVVPAPMVAASGGPERVRQQLRDGAGSERPIIVRAVFSDREVAVPLAREVGWYMPRDAMMGWRDG